MNKHAVKGFTLIELLIVIGVLSILLVFFAKQFLPFLQRGKEYRTLALMQQLAAVIEIYESANGDFPPSDFHNLAEQSPNSLNLGNESLVAAIYAPTFTGKRPDEKWLVNTDHDNSQKALTDLGSNELFELGDAWGNPLAYFHNRDYGKAVHYKVVDKNGHWEEMEVLARLNSARDNRYYKAQDYQIISAGDDGVFGTEDDLTNFQ